MDVVEKRLVEVELELVTILVVSESDDVMELVNEESKLEMIDVVDELVSEVNRDDDDDDDELVDDDVGDVDDEDKYVVFKVVDWLVSVVEDELVDELGNVDDKLDADELVK